MSAVYTAPDGKKYDRKFVGLFKGGKLVMGDSKDQSCQGCAFSGPPDRANPDCGNSPDCVHVTPNKMVQFHYKEIPNVR